MTKLHQRMPSSINAHGSTGIRGVTANPTIFAGAIEGSDAYDEQFRSLIGQGRDVNDAYWELVTPDTCDDLAVLRPCFDAADGNDGFVSLEVAPELARDTSGTEHAARDLHERIDEPNLLVKIPAAPAGVPAIQTMIGEGRSINITLISSPHRYEQVMEAHIAGPESLVHDGGGPSSVRSVASFFVSRADTEVDKQLDGIAMDEASSIRGRAAIAQAKLAYRSFVNTYSGPRWTRLAERGARVQRPLWASTSTKDPSPPGTRYLDNLIGAHTVSTLRGPAIAAFEDHGPLARAIDRSVEDAEETMRHLGELGVDMDAVGTALEDQGVSSFHESFARVLAAPQTNAQTVR